MAEASAYDWRLGKGWFRIWLVISLLWYLLAAFLLIRADFQRELQLSDRAEFSSEAALQSHVDQVRAASATVCARGTLEAKTGSYRTRGSSQLDLDAFAAEVASRDPLRAEAARIAEKYGIPRRTFPPLRTRYVSYPATCTDRHELTRTTLAAVAALAAPFAAIIALTIVFYLTVLGASVTRVAGRAGGRLGTWIAEGFSTKTGPGAPDLAKSGPPSFRAEFWADMKTVLKVAGVVVVAAWVVYSLSAGVRSDATLQALGASLVAGAGVAAIGLVILLFRVMRDRR